MKSTLRYILGFMVGLALVFLIQSLITKIWGLFGVSWGRENLPFQDIQKAGALTSTFIAGFVGPLVTMIIWKRNSWIAATLFFLIGMTMDLTVIVAGPLRELELWFRIAFVMAIPAQLLLALIVYEFYFNKEKPI